MGRVLLKAIVDDQPVSNGLVPFVLDVLAGTHEWRALADAPAALDALAHFDAPLAAGWRAVMGDDDSARAGLTLGDLPGCADADAATPLSADNAAAAVLGACRHRLFAERAGALGALRDGFCGQLDLQLQLAPFAPSELRLLVQGKPTLSAAELLGCFVPPSSSDTEAVAAGFVAAGSRSDGLFVEVLRDEALFSEARRRMLFTWCTALSALPANGLEEYLIRLRAYPSAGDSGQALPETHTCTRELHLPEYATKEQLCERLCMALDHMHDGFLNT